MFNLCNGTFRIEGSGGLRKPLQLGCDCQLLKAFVCRVFCCFKGDGNPDDNYFVYERSL